MASVALCPRCSHDLLIPNGTDPDAWAQCSACNVIFQVKDAVAHEVAELRLVEPVATPAAADDTAAPFEPIYDELQSPRPTQTVAIASEKTLGDVGMLAGNREVSLLDLTAGDAAAPSGSPKRSAPTVDDVATSSAPTWEDSVAENSPISAPMVEPPAAVDADLASAQTLADVPIPPVPTLPHPSATIELSGGQPDDADADFELGDSPEPPQTLATWDDSEHMDRLLAGDEGHPTDDAALTTAPVILAATDEVEPTDQPYIDTEMFAMPTSPHRRRRPSLVRTLAGIVLSGVVGLGLGYVLLLWLLGPSGDFLDLARFLPSATLPASFSTVPTQLADTPSPRVDPATKPATFNAPATTGKSMADDVAAMQAQEPAQFTPSDAAPLAGGDTPHVKDAPSFSADQLAVALQTAKNAQPGLIQGDLRDGSAVQRAKGYSYSVLCDLAQKATFVDAGSRSDYVATLQHEADQLFRRALADAHTRGEVARIVPKWIGSKYRNHGGVFFAGAIVDQAAKGQMVECHLDLGTGQQLTILVPEPLTSGLDQADRPVGVAGSIVDFPAQHVRGYDGDAPQAVWVGRLITLD